LPDGTHLPPALIYQGASGDLQNTWVDELTKQDEAFFASSKSGWSNNEFALTYLKQIFDPYTCDKASRSCRLLIIDGHQSHVNWDFLTTCNRFRILVCILPPHTTHRLQPLDVSLFQPLATAYSKGLNTLMYNGEGHVQVTKRLFWPLFRDAWKLSFTTSNIESGWRKTGLWPFNPPLILDTIKRPVTPTSNQQTEIKNPTTVKGLRRFQQGCLQDPSTVKLKKLIRANETLLSRTSIAEHWARNLLQALQIEKKKRQRGKKLNLAGEETSCGQWWGVAEIQKAKAQLEEKKAQEEAQATEKVLKKQQRQKERAEIAVQKDIERQRKTEERAQKAQAKTTKTARVAKKKASQPKKSCIVILKLSKAAHQPTSYSDNEVQPDLGRDGVQKRTRLGRQVQLTLRAKNQDS
jgi:hypothetical protein